jgi:hypothetical protein
MEEHNASVIVSDLKCPEYSDESDRLISAFSYWCEGVALCAVAAAGLLGNTLAAAILAGKRMRNSFNLMLVALATYDNLYLLGAILEALRKKFDLATRNEDTF